MIDKFVKILSVGKFADYSSSGDMKLRQTTLIFGENGRGKTTIAAILRSLQTGEGHHIIERATLNSTGTSEVHLLLEPNKLAKFANGKWDCPPASIDIFDVNFVYENIYIGNSVEHDHKKNLYKIIIGEKGVKLSERVDELDEQVREANKQLGEAKAAVEKKIDGTLKIDKFIELAKVDDIDQQIFQQEKVIAAQKSANDIAAKSALTKLSLPEKPDLAILAQTITDVSAATEKTVADHIATNLDTAGEEWIARGFDYAKGKSACPFCAQGIDSNALIQAYTSHFNEAYSQLKNDIKSALADLESAFGGPKLLSVQKALVANVGLADFWNRFLSISLSDLAFPTIDAQWQAIRTEAKKHLDRKFNAPLDSIPESPDLVAADAAFEELKTQVEAYNTVIDAANKAISDKKDATASGNLQAEQNKLSLLTNTKSRHTPDGDALCTAYVAQKAAKLNLDKEKSSAKDTLDQYASAIFATYQQQMNKLLAEFGADFQITNTTRSYVGGKASSSYEILINSQSVPLGDDRTASGRASFRNTLSIGDRSALALAFFLVKLANDPDLAKKCVVFDDPVSSLDRFRMGCTIQQILSIVSKAKQVIVLCHDPFCLKQLFDHLPGGQVRAFFLDRKGAESVIIPWDIEQATRSQYFQDYFSLARYLNAGAEGRDLRDIARKIRPLLEENLRVRFPDEFASGWLGDFVDRIRNAAPRTPIEALQSIVGELSQINDFSKQYHHQPANPSADTALISDIELRAFATRTLAFIRGTT